MKKIQFKLKNGYTLLYFGIEILVSEIYDNTQLFSDNFKNYDTLNYNLFWIIFQLQFTLNYF